MTTNYPYLVKVPKSEPGSYDEDRPISSLLRDQLKHLNEVEKSLPAHHQTKIDITRLRTERKASDYIRRVMAKLVQTPAKKGPPTRAKKAGAGPASGKPSKRAGKAGAVDTKRLTPARQRSSVLARKPRKQK